MFDLWQAAPNMLDRLKMAWKFRAQAVPAESVPVCVTAVNQTFPNLFIS
jgi:hypothetical protein